MANGSSADQCKRHGGDRSYKDPTIKLMELRFGAIFIDIRRGIAGNNVPDDKKLQVIVERKPPTCYGCGRKGYIRKRYPRYISNDDVIG